MKPRLKVCSTWLRSKSEGSDGGVHGGLGGASSDG